MANMSSEIIQRDPKKMRKSWLNQQLSSGGFRWTSKWQKHNFYFPFYMDIYTWNDGPQNMTSQLFEELKIFLFIFTQENLRVFND